MDTASTEPAATDHGEPAADQQPPRRPRKPRAKKPVKKNAMHWKVLYRKIGGMSGWWARGESTGMDYVVRSVKVVHGVTIPDPHYRADVGRISMGRNVTSKVINLSPVQRGRVWKTKAKAIAACEKMEHNAVLGVTREEVALKLKAERDKKRKSRKKRNPEPTND